LNCRLFQAKSGCHFEKFCCSRDHGKNNLLKAEIEKNQAKLGNLKKMHYFCE